MMEIDPETLIIEVQRRSPLYDSSSPDYCDKNKKKKLWEDVCMKVISNWNILEMEDKMKLSKDVQRRWTSLRDCFRRELTLQKRAPSANSTKKRKKYLYYSKLLFLLPHMQVSANEPSLPDEEMPEAPETTQLPEGENEQLPLEETTGPSFACSYNKRKRQKNYDEEILNLLKEEAKNKFDNDEHFLLSLVSDFKQYDETKKCLLRVELLNTISKFHQQHICTNEYETIYLPNQIPDHGRTSQENITTNSWNDQKSVDSQESTSNGFNKSLPPTIVSPNSSCRKEDNLDGHFKRRRKNENEGTGPKAKKKRLGFLDTDIQTESESSEETKEEPTFNPHSEADDPLASSSCATSTRQSSENQTKIKYNLPGTSQTSELQISKVIKDVVVDLLKEIREERQQYGKYFEKFMKPEGEDETDLFFKTMSVTLKKFDHKVKTETKMKIFNLVMEMEMLM